MTPRFPFSQPRKRTIRILGLGLVVVTAASIAGCVTAEPPSLPPSHPESVELARSVEGRPILARRWNADAGPPLLIFAGIHGDEQSAVELATRLEARWSQDPLPIAGRHVLFIGLANPDGWMGQDRRNANGVDLNRNFPDQWVAGEPGSDTYGGGAPLSEPESRLLFTLVEREQPTAILSIHSCRSCGGMNNYDGPSARIAERMTVENGYDASAEWLEETPGSFGTFAGKTLGIPTITLEVPRDVSSEAEWEGNVRAVEAFVQGAIETGASGPGAAIGR